MKVVAITGERRAEAMESKKPVLGRNQILMKVKEVPQRPLFPWAYHPAQNKPDPDSDEDTLPVLQSLGFHKHHPYRRPSHTGGVI